jgi:predicted secreted hydrolase
MQPLARYVQFMIALLATSLCGAADYPQVVPGYRIELPRDAGSHPQFRTEWWYVTGWIEDETGAERGFQITFFRSRPGRADENPSRFAAKQLLFAHAALSDPARGHLLTAEKSARAGFGLAEASEGSLNVLMDDWFLRRDSDRHMSAKVVSQDFGLELELAESQSPLLQGEEGFSQKGPKPLSASYYYSLPQLQVAGRVNVGDDVHAVKGTAWMDHEWSSEILDAEAQGWDWVGINLSNGGALMVFKMRNQAGGQHWAAATLRTPDGHRRLYRPAEIEWQSLRTWRSSRTQIEYPVERRVRVGDRLLTLRPLMDDQEHDARASTGTLYWEGAVHVLDEAGRELGRGYLEMTGYGQRVRVSLE